MSSRRPPDEPLLDTQFRIHPEGWALIAMTAWMIGLIVWAVFLQR